MKTVIPFLFLVLFSVAAVAQVSDDFPGKSIMAVPGVSVQAGPDEMVLFPNPASDVLKITFTAGNAGSGSVKVLDQIGKPVFVTEIEVAEGSNQKMIDLAVNGIRSGIYFLQIQLPGEKMTRKFIVRR